MPLKFTNIAFRPELLSDAETSAQSTRVLSHAQHFPFALPYYSPYCSLYYRAMR